MNRDDRQGRPSHKKRLPHWRELLPSIVAQDNNGLAKLTERTLLEYQRRTDADPFQTPSIHWQALLALLAKQRRRELQYILDELLLIAEERGLSTEPRVTDPRGGCRPDQREPLRAAVNHPDFNPNYDTDQEAGLL